MSNIFDDNDSVHSDKVSIRLEHRQIIQMLNNFFLCNVQEMFSENDASNCRVFAPPFFLKFDSKFRDSVVI